MKTTPLFAALLLAATSAAARDTTLNVDDSNALPMARMEIGTASATPPNEPRGGLAFELTISGGTGDSRQDVAAGQRVSMGGIAVPGPLQISNKMTLRQLDALVRWRTGSDRWLLELLGGLSAMHYTFNSGFFRTEGTPTAGVLGVGALWRVRPQTAVQARYLVGKGVSSYTESVGLDRFELAVVQGFAKNFALRAGYTVWDTTIKPSEPNSELHMRLRGPTIGLDLSF